jgi:hypothetical protein
LRVAHYRDSDGKPTTIHGEFTPPDFFAAFFTGCLRAGELFDVSCEEWDLEEEFMAVPDYDFMKMEKVSTPAIKTYLKCVLPFIIPTQPSGFVHTFTGCDIGPIDAWYADPRLDAIIFGYTIHISHIANSDTLRIYLDIAADDVVNFYISDCPGFDDSVVRHLLSETTTGRRPVPNLRALYISNCPRISLQALKEVVSELNHGRFEEADEYTWESSSEFEGMTDEFYHDVLHNSDLDRPRKPNTHNDFDYSNQCAGQRLEHSESEDLEDGDYLPPDRLSDGSVEDRDSVSLRLGPQIRKIQVSGGWPSVSQDEVGWFEQMGVELEIL